MSDVVLFGETRCHKTRFYQAALEERGIAYELAEVDKDDCAAGRLRQLTGSETKFPTLLVRGRKLRNPRTSELDKALARAGLHDPGLVHDEKSRRFVRYMMPTDGFVSYVCQGKRMILTHIEIDHSLRGTGLGARFAAEVFDHLEGSGQQARLTCPFLRRVAMTRPEWRRMFDLGEE